MSTQKVAIVCDWLVGGGAEKVVEQLHKLYPKAPVYTSYATDEWRKRLDHKVVTGPLQAWPFSKLRKFIPFLRIWWFSSLSLDNYNLVISSSGAEAKGLKVPENTIHIAYIHAPTHYYWSRYDEYLKRPGFGRLNRLARLGLKILIGPLRRWDYKAAQQPDHLIANSTHTSRAITQYYGRDSIVIHPPVDTERFRTKVPVERHGLVTAGRQVPYKRIDLAIAACTRLNLPLTVIGHGPEHTSLVKMAGPCITFVSDVNDKSLAHYFQSAEAFIFPGLEDFGITPVEALAAGTPVIAYNGGGALDFVNFGTGLFFEEQTVESLMEALKKFNPKSFSPEEIQKAATQFSAENFRRNIKQIINRID